MKYKIYIDETIRYQHEMVIEVGGNIEEGELEEILDNAERKGYQLGWDAIQGELERNDIKVLEVTEDDGGDVNEVEITDMITA